MLLAVMIVWICMYNYYYEKIPWLFSVLSLLGLIKFINYLSKDQES